MKPPSGVCVLKEKVARLPNRSGVYRMLDASGRVLYVGKAKNLKRRVTSYTQYDRLPVRLQRMVSQVCDLIVVETASEAEAFLLENELIKQYRPYYNILLKDDKSYPYIYLTSGEDFPRLSKYRGHRKEKGDYFGPYASAGAVNEALEVMQKVFGLRSCSDNAFKNRSRPCLLYQIKRCSAPCVGMISKADYARQVADVKAFLSGKKTDIQERLKKQMKNLSDNLAYEKALVLRDRIAALYHLQTYDVTLSKNIDADFIGVARQAGTLAFQIFFFRHGQNGGTHTVFLPDVEDTPMSEILESFIGQFYATVPVPHEVILTEKVSDDKVLEQALSSKAGHPVCVTSSVRGAKANILERAQNNAAESLKRYLEENQKQSDLMRGLADFVEQPLLEKVEIYDNSHIQGTSAVGAMVVATENGFEKNKYRRFNIQKAQTNDDFDMMKEVLTRRLRRGKAEGDLPSLMIIDGGLGQLSSVEKVMAQEGVSVPLLAVAKGVDRNAGKERFFLTGGREKTLPLNNPVRYFIQRLRDEAHRFAVGTHRMKRSHDSFKSALDEIEGIGSKRRKMLIEHFGSPRAVFDASLSDLLQVKNLPEKIAKNIYTFLHK